MKDDDLARYRPWIETRLDPAAFPQHKLLSRQLHLDDEPTLTIHTAGQEKVWEISIRSAAKDRRLLAGMDESDRALVQWIYEHDLDVERYNYQENT